MVIQEVKHRVVCIIQARMGSTRLPGKVLKPLLDETVLGWCVQRVLRARYVDAVVVATTTHARDDAIVVLCEREGWAVYRGSEDDVLDRYYQAATQHRADVIVRVTSDCPLIDPHVLDYTISAHVSAVPRPDYTSNFTVRTYPRGLDTEVFSMAALRRCWQMATRARAREHVTYHMYQHPEDFTLHQVMNPVDYSHYRWTVDTAEDYDLITRIFDHFGRGDFHWHEAIAAMEAHPDWVQINQHIEQKKI